jgi:glutathione S-transferase
MAQIKLYGPREAPFVLKVELALVLKKLDFTLEEPQSPEDYRRWSPETGLLPVIDVDGTRVHDSSAILDFLEERFPDPPLLSNDPKLASSQRRLESWAEETFTFYWLSYLRERVRSDEAAAENSSDPPRTGPRSRLSRRKKTATLNAEEGLGKEFGQRLDDLVNFLGRRPFFYSDRVGRADLAVYSFLNYIPGTAGPVVALLESRQPLVDLMARVEAAVHS